MSRQIRIYATAGIALLFAAISLLKRLVKDSELILMSKRGKEYSIQGINLKASVFYWMEVPCYVIMIIFTMIFHYDCPSPSVWQWLIGIIGLFLRYI